MFKGNKVLKKSFINQVISAHFEERKGGGSKTLNIIEYKIYQNGVTYKYIMSVMQFTLLGKKNKKMKRQD